MNIHKLEAKQDIALGRNKDAALGVIMPRIIGALRYEGKGVCKEGKLILEVKKNYFLVQLTPAAHDVYISVYHREYGYVFSARLYSDGAGNRLNGRVYVIGWDRSAQGREWQSELFATFTRDSDWLLSLPQKVVRPDIVTAVLSHMASQSIRPV